MPLILCHIKNGPLKGFMPSGRLPSNPHRREPTHHGQRSTIRRPIDKKLHHIILVHETGLDHPRSLSAIETPANVRILSIDRSLEIQIH